MTDWHRWLGATGEGRATGRMITGACNLAFLFLVVSGFYLWFPRTWTWRQFRAVDLVPGRPARQGARLQLAQRDRAVERDPALRRRRSAAP